MFVDTHTHLYLEEFDEDREKVISKAIHNNIKKFYLPNIDSTSIDSMHALEKQFPENCFAMMGLHPCSVKENYKEELSLIKEWLSKRQYKAVGEIGLDLYWDKTFFAEQVIAFKEQIELALNYELPIVIHCRDAFDEIYEVLCSYSKLPKGIFHCFSGSLEQAEKIIGLGNFMLGIGGVVTFKNSGLDKVVKDIDLKYIVLETDSPYLAPVPFRGKRNESVYLLEVAKKLAEIKELPLTDIESITAENSRFIFQ